MWWYSATVGAPSSLTIVTSASASAAAGSSSSICSTMARCSQAKVR